MAIVGDRPVMRLFAGIRVRDSRWWRTAAAGNDLLRYHYHLNVDKLERRVLSDHDWLRYTLARNQRSVQAAADPRELRYIDPTRVTHNTAFHPHLCWRKLGLVRGGSWDLETIPLEEKVPGKFPILEARYAAGRAWEDIPALHELIESGRGWNEHYGEDIWQWCEELDRLYESIRSRGYLAQRELLGMSYTEACAADSVHITDWLDDVLIDIGRDGELYRHEGKHRLWFAKHLGIDPIPVCVVVRHERWQAIRDEVASAESVDELSTRARRYLDHPDLIDVRAGLRQDGGRDDNPTTASVECRPAARVWVSPVASKPSNAEMAE